MSGKATAVHKRRHAARRRRRKKIIKAVLFENFPKKFIKTRAVSPISCIGPNENMKKGQGRVLWPHILGGPGPSAQGGGGLLGFRGGPGICSPRWGQDPPGTPPKSPMDWAQF